MKKLILGFMAIGLLTFVGCKKDEDTEAETNTKASDSQSFAPLYSSVTKLGSMYTISLTKVNLSESITLIVYSQSGETDLYQDTTDVSIYQPSGGYTIIVNNVYTTYVSTAIVHDSLFIGSNMLYFAPIGKQRPIRWSVVIDNGTATISGSFDAYNSSLNQIKEIDFDAVDIPVTIMQ